MRPEIIEALVNKTLPNNKKYEQYAQAKNAFYMYKKRLFFHKLIESNLEYFNYRLHQKTEIYDSKFGSKEGQSSFP